jgi:hypothetical protein
LLLAQIEQRVSKASIDLSSVCKSGLFYGDIRVLRNCVQDTDWAATCSIEDVGLPGVRNLAQRILSVLLSCASVARQGLDLQANGFVDETIETPKDILTRDLAQKVGTSCHLSVREVCHALAMVAQHMSVVHKARCGANVVMSESVALDGEMLVVLETDDMQRLGDLFDTLLQSARHNGVIKGASDGFELVCSQLLQSSLDRMRMLPLLWVGSALSNAINGEMYALRRSAGIPYHILGVIRAEAMIARRRGEQPTILCLVFDLLLNHLSVIRSRRRHLRKDAAFPESRCRRSSCTLPKRVAFCLPRYNCLTQRSSLPGLLSDGVVARISVRLMAGTQLRLYVVRGSCSARHRVATRKQEPNVSFQF